MANNAFMICEPCGGLGFLRKGEFADRTFLKCSICKGLGQIYIEPVTERASVLKAS